MKRDDTLFAFCRNFFEREKEGPIKKELIEERETIHYSLFVVCAAHDGKERRLLLLSLLYIKESIEERDDNTLFAFCRAAL